MKKIIATFVLGFVPAILNASGPGGSPTLPCFVNGVMVKASVPVQVCKNELKGDPHKKFSYTESKKTTK